ncbi:MAG: NUDIX domain-containing protein [Verrucomicrobiota bacterium]|nr:NUDIX domain-containing protein [Limisphaera sp.]MDW8381481.1 NUDIX domain-containing protein [Verrucomicrobiota bacterium]
MNGRNGECVLCAWTAELPVEWLPPEGIVPLTEQELLDTLARIRPCWRPRDEAEHDPATKQWIPYVLVQNCRGDLAAYRRRGTEARLHGLWSVGIGGHINPLDAPQADNDLRSFWQGALWAGLRRELAEEFPAVSANGSTRFLGLIHENQTELGQVHLGAVFLHTVPQACPVGGSELADLHWFPRVKLSRNRNATPPFELWSRLALQLLAHVSGEPTAPKERL